MTLILAMWVRENQLDDFASVLVPCRRQNVEGSGIPPLFDLAERFAAAFIPLRSWVVAEPVDGVIRLTLSNKRRRCSPA
jgi:hypothetical protein